MINIEKIRIPRNYVLIKPDANYETFQIGGKETGILSTNHIIENEKVVDVKSRNFSVYGTVYAVPEKIVFNRDKIKHIMERHTFIETWDGEQKITDRNIFHRTAQLSSDSCLFETENELEVGDRVKFSFQAHQQALENGLAIDTEHGLMFFVKYDLIYMSVNEDLSPKKMVNGYILVDPETIETKKSGAMDYTTTNSGLIIPSLQKRERKTRKNMFGHVVAVGKKIGGYMQFGDLEDRDVKLEVGDEILFDPRGCKRLEHHNHQLYSEKNLYLIQRRDLYLNRSENANFDKIGIEKLKV